MKRKLIFLVETDSSVSCIFVRVKTTGAERDSNTFNTFFCVFPFYLYFNEKQMFYVSFGVFCADGG